MFKKFFPKIIIIFSLAIQSGLNSSGASGAASYAFELLPEIIDHNVVDQIAERIHEECRKNILGVLAGSAGMVLAVYNVHKLIGWLGGYKDILGLVNWIGGNAFMILPKNKPIIEAAKAFLAGQNAANAKDLATKLYSLLVESKSSYCPLSTEEISFDRTGKQNTIDVAAFCKFIELVPTKTVDTQMHFRTWASNVNLKPEESRKISETLQNSFKTTAKQMTDQITAINTSTAKYKCKADGKDVKTDATSLDWIINQTYSTELRTCKVLEWITKSCIDVKKDPGLKLNLPKLFYMVTDVIITIARRHKKPAGVESIKALLNDYEISHEFYFEPDFSRFTYDSFKSSDSVYQFFGNLGHNTTTGVQDFFRNNWEKLTDKDRFTTAHFPGLARELNVHYDLEPYLGNKVANYVRDNSLDSVLDAIGVGRKTNALESVSDTEKAYYSRLIIAVLNLATQMIEQETQDAIDAEFPWNWVSNWFNGGTGEAEKKNRRAALRQASYSIVVGGDSQSQAPINEAIRLLYDKGWSSEFGITLWNLFYGYSLCARDIVSSYARGLLGKFFANFKSAPENPDLEAQYNKEIAPKIASQHKEAQEIPILIKQAAVKQML